MYDITLEPTGRPVRFRAPSYADRRQAAKMYEGRGTGYSMEELLAAYCLVQVDGQVVQEVWAADPVTRMDNWSLSEVMFYMEVFTSIGLIDEKGRQSALDLAKRLMGAGGPTPASVQTPAPSPRQQRMQSQANTNEVPVA
jgi:hypothetical protein